MMDLDPPVAFPAEPGTPPAVEIRINFGILAGREATPAEIDDLARLLTTLVQDVSIVSEQHHEIGHGREAVVHLVRVEVAEESLPDSDPRELSKQLVDAAALWARSCAQARHADV